MSKDATKQTKELFFPYYVNQGRLLDIYAILNDGYSEYTELTTAISTKKTKETKGEVAATGGFKIFNFGGSFSGGSEKGNENRNENKEKKVQTVTSVLSIVKSSLKEKNYLKDIKLAKPGEFICIPVILRINSIKSLIAELTELLKLYGTMQKLSSSVKKPGIDTKDFEYISKSIQVLFDGEEILYDAGEYAIIGNIVDSNLYQADRADIIGAELNCLAQVKRVFPNGCELMRNTVFTKIKDHAAKEKLANSLSSATDNNTYDFDAVAVASIDGKPVYQLEIIALYQ